MKRHSHCTKVCSISIISLFLSVSAPSVSSAQITVTQSLFTALFTAGQSHFYYHPDGTVALVNIGKKGGANVYDFSGVKLTPVGVSNNYAVTSIPVIGAHFPAGAVTFGDSRETIEKNPVFLITGDSMFTVGQASVIPQIRFEYYRPYEVIPVPLTYQGKSVRSGILYDTTFNASGSVVSAKQSPYKDSVIVDGYGTLKILGRQLECLRMRMDHVTFGDREYMYLTREGIFVDIMTSFSQADTGSIPFDDMTILVASSLVGVNEEAGIPLNFGLGQNYPNPFNPSTTIRYQLPKEAIISLKIFNTLGQTVATLVDGQEPAGQYQVQWNANVSSGIYFYRLQSGEFVETRKMLLLRWAFLHPICDKGGGMTSRLRFALDSLQSHGFHPFQETGCA